MKSRIKSNFVYILLILIGKLQQNSSAIDLKLYNNKFYGVLNG
jgi:hypothetical protein